LHEEEDFAQSSARSTAWELIPFAALRAGDGYTQLSYTVKISYVLLTKSIL